MDEKRNVLYDQLEVARIIGQPVDPRKPYPTLVEKLCETDSAEPEEYVYYFDVLVETEKIYVITSNGAVTQENVSPDTPAALTFADLATPEYYVKVTDYASRKEAVLARKKATINRALNSYETYKVITLLATAASSSGNTNTLGSGYTRFSYPHLVTMLEQVQSYGDRYVLVVGATVDRDITLWNWNDNKYQSLKQAFEDLNIEKVRLSLGTSAAQVSIDDDNSGGVVATDILSATVAYLVAIDTEAGKPLLWVRKKLDSVKMLGGVLTEDGGAPERIVFVSPNPITVTGTARYLGIGLTGYEQYAAAVVNPYAVSSFSRA